MPTGELIANKTSALVADSADGAHLFASARSLGVDAGELFRRACSMASEAPAARTGAFNRRHARSRRVLPGDACARGKWWLRHGAGHDHIDRVVSARSRSLRPIVAFPKKVSGQESRQMSRACRLQLRSRATTETGRVQCWTQPGSADVGSKATDVESTPSHN